MSKKDFIALARAFHSTRAAAKEGDNFGYNFDQWEMDVAAVADVLQATNPRFDRARFITACETGTCKGMPR